MPTLEEILAQDDARLGTDSPTEAGSPQLPDLTVAPTRDESPPQLPSLNPDAGLESILAAEDLRQGPQEQLPGELPPLPTEERNVFAQVGNVVGSFFEGAGQQAITTINPRSSLQDPFAQTIDFADQEADFASQVAAGVGQGATQIGTIGAGAAAGAAAGSVVPGLGTAIGGAVGAGAAALGVGIQNIRRSLFGVEQDVLSRGGTEEDVAQARSDAFPAVVAANTAEQIFLFFTGGAGSLATATAKEAGKTALRSGLTRAGAGGLAARLTGRSAEEAARLGGSTFAGIAGRASADLVQNTREQLIKEAAKTQITRAGRIANALKVPAVGAVTEGASEAVEGAATRAAADAAIDDTNFIDELQEELTSDETAKDFLLGGAVGGILGGAAPVLAKARQAGNDFEEGLQILENQNNLTAEQQRALQISRLIAPLNAPDLVSDRVVVPEVLATTEELRLALRQEPGLSVTKNDDGSTTLEVTDRNAFGTVLGAEPGVVSVFDPDPRNLKSGRITIDPETDSVLVGYDVSPVPQVDENGNVIEVPTLEDLVAERMFLKLVDPDGVELNFDQTGIEGTNLESAENQELFSTTLETTTKTSSLANATNRNPKNALAAVFKKTAEGIQAVKEATLDTDFAKRTLTPEGILPESAFNIKVQKKALKEEILVEATKNIDRLNRGIDEYVRRVTKTGVKSEARVQELREEANLSLNSYLRGDIKIDQIPGELRLGAKIARGQVDRLSRRIVETGELEGPMVQVIEENQGTYLNRNYKIFDDPNWVQEILSDETANGVYNQAKAWVRMAIQENRLKEGKSLLGGEQLDTKIEKVMQDLLTVGENSPIKALEKLLPASNKLGALLQRKEVPEVIRALWGERKGGIENYAYSVAAQMGIIADLTYNAELAASGLSEGWLSKSLTKEHTARIEAVGPGTDLIANPLAGLYTSPRLAKIFNQEPDARPPALLEWYFKANLLSKYAKTVLSPITHVRNLYGNIPFLVANGNGSALFKSKQVRENARAGIGALLSDVYPEGVVNAAQNWRKLTDEQKQEAIEQSNEVLARYRRLGVIGDDIRSGEFYDSLNDAFETNKTLTEWVESRFESKSKLAKANESIGRLYQAEDAIFKIIAFEGERAKYQKAFLYENQDLSDPEVADQLDQIAAQNTRATMMTYSFVPEYVKELRRLPVGPFISFPAEVLRTQVNVFKLGFKETRSSNKEIQKIGAKRLAAALTVHSLSFVGLQAIASMLGITEEEREAANRVAYPWDKSGLLIPLPEAPDGNPRYLNVSHSDPFSVFYRTFRGAPFKAELNEENVIASALYEFFAPFIQPEILVRASTEAAFNTKAGGGRVYNPEEDESLQYLSMFKHVYKAIEPGALETMRRLWSGVSEQPVGPKGRERQFDLFTETLALATGMRVTTVKKEESLGFALWKRGAGIQDAENIYRRTVRDKNATDLQVENAFVRMRQAQKRQYRQLQKDLEAYAYFGIEQNVLEEKLKKTRGISADEAYLLMNGDLPKYRSTDNLLDQVADVPGRAELMLRLERRLQEQE
jgi:hypothetical protein